MPNQAICFKNSIKKYLKPPVYDNLNGWFRNADIATAKKQGIIIKKSIKKLNKLSVDLQPIMRDCNCLSTSVINQAKKLYADSNGNLKEFLLLLNNKKIGGGNLYLDKNNVIIGTYNKCYCKVPIKSLRMPGIYCECSAGWFEKLFQSVLERDVKVEIIHTINNGFKECLFNVHIKDI